MKLWLFNKRLLFSIDLDAVPRTSVVLERGHAVVSACASSVYTADEVAAIRTRRPLSAHFSLHGRLLWCHLCRKSALDDQFKTRVSF